MKPDHISEPYNNWADQEQPSSTTLKDTRYMANYMARVYGWMFLGLAITAIVAFLVASTPSVASVILSSRLLFLGIVIGELVLVGYLVVRIRKLSPTAATFIFLAYAALNGLVFSVLFFAYTTGSLLGVFAITAGTFGVMSAVGYFTKQDLTSFGKIMMMGLVGIIIASVVNWFMHSETLYWIISYVGVAVFVGLIAYDTQKIKSYAYLEREEDRRKGAVMGALSLYLDFVNLFIMLLRLFGGRRS